LARWSSDEPNSYARVFGYDEEGRLVKIERDYGGGDVQLAYEYGYNSDGVRVWKRDGLAGQEYRYICRIGCGGVPMRVYNRAMGGSSWVSVEDYLPAGNALGYNENWQYRHSGGELLMMGATGEPSGYYPSDAVGFHTQSVPTACACLVEPQAQAVCAPLENCGATCDIALLGSSGNPDMPYLNLYPSWWQRWWFGWFRASFLHRRRTFLVS
jgi:hypothetical protein